MSLSPDEASRLAFIRYLHHQSMEQGRLPEPQSSAAVLLLHDAVEAFLLLAAEHLGATAPRDFVQYWDTLSPAKVSGGVKLAVKQGMARLNRVRVNLKHHGVQPGKAAIEKGLTDGTTFFAANTPLVFGVDYDQVSMADLIEQEQVRELVHKAESAAAGGDHAGAMIALSDACELLLMPRRSSGSHPSPLRFGESVRLAVPGLRGRVSHALQPPRDTRGIDVHGRDRQFVAEHISTLTDTVAALQEAAKVTTLGIDYAAYLKFSRLIPIHSDNAQGVRKYRAPAGYAPTSNDVGCYQFVISASLRLTEAHAHLELPSWLAAGARPWEERWETIATGKPPYEGYM
jgi:hypothetical protein